MVAVEVVEVMEVVRVFSWRTIFIQVCVKVVKVVVVVMSTINSRLDGCRISDGRTAGGGRL